MRLFILCLLYAPLAMAGNTASEVNALKSLDGKTTYCQHQGDIGNVGYHPSLPIVLGGDELVLSFAIIGVECNYSEANGHHWGLRSLLESVPGRDIYGQQITTHVRSAEAVLVDENYKIVGIAPLNETYMQLVRLPLALDRILNREQRRSIGRGQEVKIRLEYFNRSRIEVERAGRTVFKGQQSGGSYFYSFTVSREPSGELKASAVLTQ
jgi:hypothetical protein